SGQRGRAQDRINVHVPDRVQVLPVAGLAAAKVHQAQVGTDDHRRRNVEPGAVVRLGGRRLIPEQVADRGHAARRGDADGTSMRSLWGTAVVTGGLPALSFSTKVSSVPSPVHS